jgi:LemA protein
MVLLIPVLVLVALLLVLTVSMYNSLVRLRNEVRNGWSQIDVQLKRRHDLIPNLVETVKGYASHEKETLENVTKARNQAVSAQGVEAQGQAEAGLTAALSRLMVVVERYPELKANQNFRDLQVALEGTENRIAVERGRYNESAQAYNTRRLQFPTVLFANLLGMREKAYFKAAPGSEQAPPVKFSFGATPAPAEQR